jgi:hypothetical protein
VPSGHTHGGQLWPFDYVIRLDQPVIELRWPAAEGGAAQCRCSVSNASSTSSSSLCAPLQSAQASRPAV